MKPIKINSNYIHLILPFIVSILFFNPFNVGNIILPILFIYILFQIKNNKLLTLIFHSFHIWWLLLFCVLYVSVQIQHQFIEVNTGLRFFLYFMLLYVFGLTTVVMAKNEKQIMYYLYAIIIGLSMFGIAAVIYSNIFYGLLADLVVRRATIPWMEEVELGGTGIGMYVALGIALFGLMFTKSNLGAKVLNILIAILSLYASISLANRTGLLLALFSIVTVYFVQARLNSLRHNIKLAAIFIAQFAILVYLFNINFLNVKSFWLQSHAYYRITTMDVGYDPRFVAWGEAMEGIFTNPLGGKETKLSLEYAHNLWLDVGYTAGLLPFIFLVIFTIMTFHSYIRLLRKDSISKYFKYLVTAMLCGFFVTFMVEPVIEGNFLLFGAFCMFSGIVKAVDSMKMFNADGASK